MTAKLSDHARAKQLAQCFAAIEQAAIAGARCPENGVGAVSSHAVGELARQGRLRVLISGRNYRTVKLLDGPHAGARTKPDPHEHPVWKLIDASGTHVHGRLISNGRSIFAAIAAGASAP